MRYAFLIAWREYAENAKTKGFWLGLLIFPAILALSIQVPILLEKKGTPTRHLVIADASGEFAPLIAQAIAREDSERAERALQEFVRRGKYPETLARFVRTNRTLDLAGWKADQGTNYLKVTGFAVPHPRFRLVALPEGVASNAAPDVAAQQLRPWLRGERQLSVEGRPVPLFAAVLLAADLPLVATAETGPKGNSEPANAASRTVGRGIHYWSENLADTALADLVENTINTELRRRAYVAHGLDPATVREVERIKAPLTSFNPKKAAGEETVGLADRIRQWLPSLFVYLLWVAIFSIAQMLLTSVIEEKSNRIIEVLLSSVTPGELMVGKLAGIAAIGLTMLAVWVASLVTIVLWKSIGMSPEAAAAAGGMAGVPGDVATILRTTWLLPAFAVYFLLGFLFYSGLILALGSTCNTLKEAQSFMGVIVLLLMVPLLMMTYIPRDPNGTLATALSWFPPYTPFVMMNRVTADPPLRDVLGTMALLLVCTVFVLWGSGRIFRRGILRTGQPPELLELLKWLRR
jgi:ABC-2 type transport system permease protein